MSHKSCTPSSFELGANIVAQEKMKDFLKSSPIDKLRKLSSNNYMLCVRFFVALSIINNNVNTIIWDANHLTNIFGTNRDNNFRRYM